MADWDQIIAAARSHGITIAQYQRELILRYPDVAVKLTAPPLSLANPQQWSGYIPGPYHPEDEHGRVRPNRSPVRAQLLALLDEAAHRADGTAITAPAAAAIAPTTATA
jgi:hypothetical protein